MINGRLPISEQLSAESTENQCVDGGGGTLAASSWHSCRPLGGAAAAAQSIISLFGVGENVALPA